MIRRFSILLATAAALCAMVAPLTAATGRWAPVGPGGGGPQVIAADPHSGTRLFAAFPQLSETLVLRTEDGATWQEANDGLEGVRVLALAVDPVVPDRVYAVAAAQGCFTGGPGGIYRSDDAGAHWQLVATAEQVGRFECEVGLLVLDHAVLIGTATGVSRSTDGGATWQQTPLSPAPEALHTLLRDPSDPQILYAAGLAARFKSRDGGLSWTLLDDPASHSGQWVTAFALSASDPETLYAFGPSRSFWRSRDGGATWGDELSTPNSRFFYNVSLLVEPHDSETVFFGTEDGLWASHDGGATFRRSREGLPPLAIGQTFFPGVSDLVLDATNRILAATPKGLWSSRDAGDHWTKVPLHGVHADAVRFLRFDPFQPRRFVFASFETLLVSRDGGRTTAQLTVPRPGYLRALEFDPFERNRLVAVTWEGFGPETVARLFESRDGGRTWGPPVSLPDLTSEVAIPAPNTLLVAAENRLYLRSEPDGAWHRRLQVEPTDGDRGWFAFHRLVADPYRPGALFALGNDHFLHGGFYPEIYHSLDAGRRWSHWERGASTLAFHPDEPNLVYFGIYADIFGRRITGGANRRIGTVEGGATTLLIDRGDARTFYVTTPTRGVLVSRDEARTWSPLAPGLPFGGTVPVSSLDQDPLTSRRLYATPSTGGLWRLDLPRR